MGEVGFDFREEIHIVVKIMTIKLIMTIKILDVINLKLNFLTCKVLVLPVS